MRAYTELYVRRAFDRIFSERCIKGGVVGSGIFYLTSVFFFYKRGV